MPDALVLVDDAGNIRELYDMQADVSCVEVTADACQTSLGTCDFVYNRDAYVVGADLAFSADGKTGTGTQTVAVYAADGTTCSGEFNVALTRQ